MNGSKVFSPELIVSVIHNDNPLTNREQEILRLAAEGKTVKEIAKQLFLSSGTVPTIYQKLSKNWRQKN